MNDFDPILTSVARVHLRSLKELWFHTGTACNLECPFCLEGSKPADTRLERVKLPELKSYLDEAAALGVERFGFTGGEPLIVKDIVRILEYALSLRPCLVLTNGTAPLLKRVHQLELLKRQPHPLSFRVSIDHPDEQQHDTGRGWGNFRRAIDGMKLLHAHGFAVSIARQMRPDEDRAAVEAQYQELLRKAGLPASTRILPLPEFGALGIKPDAPAVTGADLQSHAPCHFMCTYSRMVLKKDGQMRVYACAFVDDDPAFDLGASLGDATAADVRLTHHRCNSCLRHGATYSE